ncbi:methyl-accepting chemotaxis protein [Paenibacillus sp. 19GGS1-52]|uniref:methyl-accepting chemotaxis protein n=1 Tax=Paenibacillus sp. 19GGS1-52 TaxID=2758563 RepID=UPI001EFABC27|nr:methyl-accepting chemotaxis protein [Paenibacillus sp. 19GGS1-52]ULO06081.1 methyl-accepting chemotaxis protein [Paenibacillus sp. 19GGS1-52]
MKSKARRVSVLNRLHPSKSLGLRLFLVFFIATMVLVLSLGYTSYSVAKQTIERNALSSSQQTVVQTADKIDVVMQRFEDNLGQIFYNREIQDAFSKVNLEGSSSQEIAIQSSQIVTELNDGLSGVKGVQAVYLIPMKASLPIAVAGTKDSAFIEGARAASWFKQLQDKPQSLWLTQTVQKGDTSGVIHFAKSIEGITKDAGYIAVSDIKVSELESQLSKVNLGVDSYIQLLTSKDELIVSSLHQGSDSYLSLGGTLLNGVGQTSGSLPTVDEQGKSILAVYSTLASSGWRLLGVVPSENLFKDANRILQTTYIAVAAAAVVAILIGLWMVRMVSRPLTRLKDLMSEGAEGNLRVRTTVTSRDEIGQLSSSFNMMMERITELVTHTNETAREVLVTADALSIASHKTAESAKDIAAATEEIAGGAGSLALEADRGNGLTGEISEQMNTVLTATHEMDNMAHNVGQSSEEGVDKLQKLLVRTSLTGDMTNTLVRKVNELKETTTSVIKVLEVMKSITQQTNILSLNASIEASRAGEAGHGFMVVAREIRQLADQSKRNIAIVGDITDRIMIDMNDTVAALSEVAPLFKEQIISVQDTSNIFESVQEQMNHFIARLESVTMSIDGLNQSQGVLSETMSNVSAVAEQSSASSQEVASLSGEQQGVSTHLVELSVSLENASHKLREGLSKFRV